MAKDLAVSDSPFSIHNGLESCAYELLSSICSFISFRSSNAVMFVGLKGICALFAVYALYITLIFSMVISLMHAHARFN